MNRRPDLVLGLKELHELESIALRCPYNLSGLSYRESQQILTIYSLIEWIQSYQISPQIGLDLPQEVTNVRSSKDD